MPRQWEIQRTWLNSARAAVRSPAKPNGARRADPPAPFDSDDAIVPPSLEHVTIDARRPKEGRWCADSARWASSGRHVGGELLISPAIR